MTPAEVKRELYEIGKRYPSLLGLMKKQVNGSTVGSYWTGELTDLDAGHFQDVCDEYASFRRPIPERSETLPYEIREEVFRRVEKDRQALERHAQRLEFESAKKQRADRRADQ